MFQLLICPSSGRGYKHTKEIYLMMVKGMTETCNRK